MTRLEAGAVGRLRPTKKSVASQSLVGILKGGLTIARLSALIAVVAALAVAPVQAASFSSASLSDMRITLSDLNPADGITPGITFREPYQGDCFRRCAGR